MKKYNSPIFVNYIIIGLLILIFVLGKILGQHVNLINNFASAGLTAFQTNNDDLRMILDNFLNGGQTTTFGTVLS